MDLDGHVDCWVHRSLLEQQTSLKTAALHLEHPAHACMSIQHEATQIDARGGGGGAHQSCPARHDASKKAVLYGFRV